MIKTVGLLIGFFFLMLSFVSLYFTKDIFSRIGSKLGMHEWWFLGKIVLFFSVGVGSIWFSAYNL